jgi:transcriptional regulator with XRE-family HTH domain
MDEIRFGRQFRALRLHKDMRQDDVGRIAKVSRSLISRIDRGRIENIQVGELERAAAALGATVELRLRWNGEQLDRLLDEAHARVVDKVLSELRAASWDVAVEVSFSIWGERGSIDVFAFHLISGIVLVVEVKSVVPDSQETLHVLDRKTRLAAQIANDRGWESRGVARLLVVGDSATSRRRIARLTATYEAAFPVRGLEVRRWLREPHLPISGLLFVAYAPRGSVTNTLPGRQRVRRGRRRSYGTRVAPIAPGESV